MKQFFEPLLIKKEQEHFWDIMQSIQDGIEFRWTNLWVLIFAIILASIGLNLNSWVVIIGAMLISPLMWPIIGIWTGIAVNDSSLVKNALRSILFAVAISLLSSSFYFLISPLWEAHSELLARTYPTIWDVLIALFWGLSAVIGIASQKKGNIIPWAAIATALMPPLCTAWYGIATWQPNFIFGALYLFFINAVFIAISAIIVARLLKFPYKHFPDTEEQSRSRKLIILIWIATLIPSLYFGYNQINDNTFLKNSTVFIEKEAQFPDDYLLKKTIEPKTKTITLIYWWKIITEEQIQWVRNKLPEYNLEAAHIEIKQWFASLYEAQKDSQKIDIQTNQNQIKIDELTAALAEKEEIIKEWEWNAKQEQELSRSVLKEIQVINPKITNITLAKETSSTKDHAAIDDFIILETRESLNQTEEQLLNQWLKIRLNKENVSLFISQEMPDLPTEENISIESKTDTPKNTDIQGGNDTQIEEKNNE